MPPSISVIVPTTARRETLVRTLVSLEQQDLVGTVFEVVVVVDGHAGDLAERIEACEPPYCLRVLCQERQGAAAARNLGARSAEGALLVFLDDDIAVKPDFLTRHGIAHSGEVPKLLAFGRIVTDPASPITFLRTWMDRWQEDYFGRCERGEGREPHLFCSANFSVAKDPFLAVGGFDEEYVGYGWEEADLGIRLEQDGFRFVYLAEAIGSELYVKSPDEASGRPAFEKGKNEVLFLRKHPGMRRFGKIREAFDAAAVKRAAIRLAWHAPRLLEQASTVLPTAERRYRTKSLARFWGGVKAAEIEWRALDETYKNKLIVLGYHDITKNPDPRNPHDIRVDDFQRQMRFLKDHDYRPISLQELVAWLAEGQPLPRRAVYLTFDDGYASFARVAGPLLEVLGFPAVVFVCPGLVGGENRWDSKLGMKEKPLMGWDEIAALSPSFEIGAHGLSHRDLTILPEAEARREIFEAVDQIEEKVGRPRAFSYPYGFATERIVQLTREAGVLAAFSADAGRNGGEADPLRLKRAMLRNGEGLLSFRWRLRAGTPPMESLRVLWRHRIQPRRSAGADTDTACP